MFAAGKTKGNAHEKHEQVTYGLIMCLGQNYIGGGKQLQKAASGFHSHCPRDHCVKLPLSVTPEDPFAFRGELLRLCCNVTGTYCDLSDHCNITFYKKGKNNNPIYVQSWSTQATPLVCMSQAVAAETANVGYYCAISQPLEQCMGYQFVRTDCKLSCCFVYFHTAANIQHRKPADCFTNQQLQN